MADAIVSFVVNKIGDYLIREASLLLGVKQEVEKLQSDLACLQGLVQDAEQAQHDAESRALHNWVSQVRELAYDIEDILDTYVLKADERRNQRQRFLAHARNWFCACKEKADLYGIGKEIKILNGRISHISTMHHNLGIGHIGKNREEGSSWKHGKLRELRRAPSRMPQEHVVGVEDEVKLLRTKLLDRSMNRIIVSIYGMGGLGKTTLARKLYNSNNVRSEFDCHAWVSVSQDYNTRDLLQKIIKSFWSLEMQELEKLRLMAEEDLERYLLQHLSEKKYLIVIDDVWEKEAWQSLRRAFPDATNGSRVIMTTRIRDVAECIDERTYAHKLRLLNFKESWELFCGKAFQSSDDADREEKEKIGNQMVQKCNGLPLAIIVLGGLLSGKNVGEWQKVHDNLWRHLEKESLIDSILALSFEDLPHQLKLCFLYLSVYPEDFDINTAQLILLLLAEGLIPNDEGQIEEVAEDYLLELADRRLIQAERKRRGKISEYCQVHDLLRDLALKKAKELNFIHVYNENSGSNASSCRRQAIHIPLDRQLSNMNSRARSLIFFRRFEREIDYTIFFKRFRLLRVLDISVMGLTEVALPEGFGELILLRYLRIVFILTGWPASTKNLRNLETLIIENLGGLRLNLDIRNLKSLRHLSVQSVGDLLIGDAECLQTLKGIPWDSWCKIKPEKLVELRELRIIARGGSRGSRSDVFASFHSFSGLKNLRELSISGVQSFAESSFQELSLCPNLIDLRLKGVLKKLPEETDRLLPNLESLWLRSSEFEEDPMPVLAKLPKLKFLGLGRQIFFSSRRLCIKSGFPQLECLDLLTFDEVEELFVEESAMPKLKYLVTELPNEKLRIPTRLLPTVTHEWAAEVINEFSREFSTDDLLPLIY